jgi:hypothetical protein
VTAVMSMTSPAASPPAIPQLAASIQFMIRLYYCATHK